MIRYETSKKKVRINPLSILSSLATISGIAFLVYGPLCIFSSHMKREFQRYRLSSFRTLVGALEVLGGLGVLLGQIWSPLLAFSAAGLSLLMTGGVIVRWRLRDRPRQIAPAAVLLLVNAYITWLALQ